MKVKSNLQVILGNSDLEISSEKTNIRHLTEGFDFLGCTSKSFKSSINIKGNRGGKKEGSKLRITRFNFEIPRKTIFDS